MFVRRSAVLLLLLAVAGCDQTDPYRREGVWRPNGANDIDLRAMVVVPSDLAVAARAAPADGGLAAAALGRLRHDQVKPLMDSGLAQIAPVASAPAAQPSPAPAGENGN